MNAPLNIAQRGVYSFCTLRGARRDQMSYFTMDLRSLRPALITALLVVTDLLSSAVIVWTLAAVTIVVHLTMQPGAR